MKASLEASLAGEAERLVWYSPLNFLRQRTQLETLTQGLLEELVADVTSKKAEVFESGNGIYLIWRQLEWDTNYFGMPTFRLDFLGGLRDASDVELQRAIIAWRERLAEGGRDSYLFAEVPVEDIQVLRSLTAAGVRLIETRLTYRNTEVQSYAYPERFQVRDAQPDDIPTLKEAARRARNPYDRFHADPLFPPGIADEFLATFVENSIHGYADIVLVPKVPGKPAGAFLTANFDRPLSRRLNVQIARMVLSAVSPECAGWYTRLISEMTYRFQELDIACAYMTTQATNRAVLRVWEKLGYTYGRGSHVLALGQRGIE